MVTVAVPAGETQPAAEISVTESVTLPSLPADWESAVWAPSVLVTVRL
jgi:hypothetical protein